MEHKHLKLTKEEKIKKLIIELDKKCADFQWASSKQIVRQLMRLVNE